MNKQIRSHVSGVVLLLFVSTLCVGAERAGGSHSLNWDRDVRVAWQSALRDNRPLLLFLTMDGCVYCQKMKQTTLQDQAVVNDLQKLFVPVALNVKDAPDLVERLQVKSLPTTVIIETNGDVVESITGFQTAQQLRQRLHATLRLVAQERDQEREIARRR